MSILKLKIQDFREVTLPREGWVFLGYDTSGGTIQYGALAQMDEFGNIVYIESGTTTGVNGTSGISGTSGRSSSSGTSSTSGTSGISVPGSIGPSGSAGTSGADGVFLGTNGSSGSSGSSGIDGTSGSSGSSGVDGTSGSSGIDGTSGTSGSSGIDGTSGSSGIDGTSGTSGKDGNFFGSSGTSGDIGPVGSSGTSGMDGNFLGSSGTSGMGSSGTSGSDLNSFTWVVSEPQVGDIPGPKIYNGLTRYNGISVHSYISGGTDLTFNLQNRFSDAILVSGMTIYTGITTTIPLEDDYTQFQRYNPTLVNNSWLWLDIISITGFPDKFIVTVFVTPYGNP